MRTRPRSALVLLAVSALVLTACGDDDDDAGSAATTAAATGDTTSGDATTPGDDTTAAAESTPAGSAPTTETPTSADPNEPPVTVGFHNLEGGSISLPEIREGFLSGVNYVNEELGGINGRPLEAVTCNLDVTPSRR